MRQFWVVTWARIKGWIPSSIRKRRLNFISSHYLYIISMAFLGSIIIVAAGDMAYIDALFFASGSATQSGLNTVDINKTHTSQQLVMYFLAMLCNPIIIHSTVVFVRLYWFEKRFQHVVREARSLRRTRSRSRTNTQAKEDLEANIKPNTVRGQDIVVLRTDNPEANGAVQEKDRPKYNSDSATSSSKTRRESREHTDVAEDTVVPRDSSAAAQSPGSLRVPQQMSADQHIAFLENQRNPKDKLALRIPSPREYDRGGVPETVDDVENRLHLMNASPTDSRDQQPADIASRTNNLPMRQHITIDEPDVPRDRSRTTTFPRLHSRAITAEDQQEPGSARFFNKSRSRMSTFSSILRSNTERNQEPMPYLSWEPTIGRNSMFINLTEEQRDELGGIEYRALKTLALTLSIYFFSFHFLGLICLTPWIMKTSTYGNIVRSDGQGRPWWGVFTAASAFNDLGFTLTPDSMISFASAVFPLLLMSFLIIIGNTGFPCMLRFVIWATSKIVPSGSGLWEELQFLLDHPRRCFTLLFPRAATWWLFAILVILNGVDLIFYIILDLSAPAVTSFPTGIRLLDGLFQAASTRTAGFSCVNLADLHPGIQVSYLVMMYISVFPIAISMRRTNVYEEKSLGIYGNPEEEEEQGAEPSYVGAHLRKQLSFDLWYIFMGMFFIAIIEGPRIQNINQPAFTLFSILFEIVSAYGTVGLSLGYPNVNTSFSGQFRVLSKLIIIAMQVRGRHRGLPYAVDRAILLPSEGLHKKEDREGEKHLRRRGSGLSQMSGRTTGNYPRDISLATGMESSPADEREHNGGPVRRSLGTAMFRLAAGPDAENVKKKMTMHGSGEH